MTHAKIVAAIESHGGRLVASFVLDAQGRTVGSAVGERRAHHCTACGERGHTVRRCNGEGVPPRPTYDERVGRSRR